MTSTLQIRHILLPIDESPGTQLAVDYAALLARTLGASLTLVHIDELPNAMVGIVPGATVEGDLAVERLRSDVYLTRIAAALIASGLTVDTLHVTASTIAAALVEVARDHPFDLIVMATHARVGVARLVLGSIAEQVLRHAPSPVMTVHVPTGT